MSFEVPEPTSGQLLDFYNTVLQGKPYNSMAYLNTVLSAEELDDSYDPKILIDPYMGSSYWPGGIDVFEGRREYIMHSLNGHSKDIDMAEERLLSRRVLLAASIGTSALQRYEEHLPQIAKDKIAEAGYKLVPYMLALCESFNIPFGTVVFSRVLRSQLVPEGTRMAHIYYPIFTPPKTALSHIRRSVSRMVSDETVS